MSLKSKAPIYVRMSDVLLDLLCQDVHYLSILQSVWGLFKLHLEPLSWILFNDN